MTARRGAGADDLDEIAIERAVAGDGIRLAELTPAEQAEVVRQLTERGKSIRDIAYHACRHSTHHLSSP